MSFPVFRQLLCHLLVVLGFFLILDRSAALGLQALLRQSEFRFSRLYRGEVDADIVVLGNSRAVNAFFAPAMEERLEKNVFHLGYNGMSMVIAETLFLDYLEHNESPGMLILEVTNLNVANDLLKDLKLYAGMSPRIRRLLSVEAPLLRQALRATHLYRFNGELFLRSLFYLDQSDQSWINSGQIDPEFAHEYRPSAEDEANNIYPTAGPNWNALRRLIALCGERGIELRLVASPYLPAFRDHLPHYEIWTGNFREKLPKGVDFHDFSDSLRSHEFFADVLHLNRRGGQALLEEMIHAGLFSESADN